MKHTLTANNLTAGIENKEILHGVSMTVRSGEVHAIMGPNGSGKSTFSSVLLGHPAYHASGTITVDKTRIDTLPTEARVKAGLFLAFQSPVAITGVTVMNLLRTSYEELHRKAATPKTKTIANPILARRSSVGGLTLEEFSHRVSAAAKSLNMDESFLRRGIHDGFSGGEKKKIEMLQAIVLEPSFAIFDEIDTGLDVDALRVVAEGIEVLRSRGVGVMIITHYQRILKYVTPGFVHILVRGKIVAEGDASLAKTVEEDGYKRWV
jgi:Fe-S cluster assembly ATP-binding protein